jgi:lipooligosaccharide transport system ATP-binding protein
MNHPVIVNASNLTKSYDTKVVVKGISFALKKGECCGILGPNGAGKTTTLRMLVGHTAPDSGTLDVLGYTVPDKADQMRSKVGVVPQIDNLDPDFSVSENLYSYGRYFGYSRQELEPRVQKLLKFASLEDKVDSRIQALSGGMKRRLTLARSLINDPELLILDEPTTGLDPQARQLIWQQLRLLQKEGLTIIITTHYMEEAERLCDRIIVMDKGTVLADERPEKLIEACIEPHVLEVHGDNSLPWHDQLELDEAIRCEQVGETWFYYGKNLQPLIESLEKWSQLRYLYRPANLEDVFLKLTGRDLHDD